MKVHSLAAGGCKMDDDSAAAVASLLAPWLQKLKHEIQGKEVDDQ
jgi:hypothetical protein